MSESDGSRKRAASIASTAESASPPRPPGGGTPAVDSNSSSAAPTPPPSSKKKQKKGGRGASNAGNAPPYVPPGVVISRSAEDCAPQLSLSKDQLTVTGNKGFRMARATHGVCNGTWFWECTVLPPETREGHCRLGWSLSTGSLQGPVGYDKSSYAYRDIAGSKVHESLRTDNCGEPWGPGDVVGFLIRLKSPSPEELRDTAAAASDSGRLSVAAAAAALAAGGSPSERAATAAAAVAAGGANAFNEIRFFKNGKDQGVAFSGIKPGTYFPAVSLYMGGSVRANFGPEFVYPPPSSHRWKPIANLRPFTTKEETKAQRIRTKRERAARGLETATRQSGGGHFAGVNGASRTTPNAASAYPSKSSGAQKSSTGAAGTRSSKSSAHGAYSNREQSRDYARTAVYSPPAKGEAEGTGEKTKDGSLSGENDSGRVSARGVESGAPRRKLSPTGKETPSDVVEDQQGGRPAMDVDDGAELEAPQEGRGKSDSDATEKEAPRSKEGRTGQEGKPSNVSDGQEGELSATEVERTSAEPEDEEDGGGDGGDGGGGRKEDDKSSVDSKGGTSNREEARRRDSKHDAGKEDARTAGGAGGSNNDPQMDEVPATEGKVAKGRDAGNRSDNTGEDAGGSGEASKDA